MMKGRTISVILAGERWEDNTLRPCFEDFIGAGSIIRFLRGKASPEAIAAAGAFETASKDLFDLLQGCSSGKEKIEKGETDDIRLAAELNISDCVPVMTNGAFIRSP
jgi:2-phosphosulfolactate phosphatase